MAYVWGVDSASQVNEQLLQCVLRNFGKPRVWGRYLSTVPRAAEGLSNKEIALLHRNGIKILPIYNDFRHAIGYQNGKTVARNAAHHAVRLEIPKGTFIFANIEHFFHTDEAWIRGWADTVRGLGYKSGIYHDPIRGPFSSVFCKAVKKDYRIYIDTALWSAQPEKYTTGAKDSPAFSPKKPRCKGNVWAWQYGRDSKVCPIDTDLIDLRLYNQLF